MAVSSPVVTINTHTTASSPRPHILYAVQATRGGKDTVVHRRYSEFVALHNKLQPGKDVTISLPPKRILVTSFVPSAWLDDVLIEERKTGLAAYLNALLGHPTYQDAPVLKQFLGSSDFDKTAAFDLEDALPSTMSRNKALELKAQLLNGNINGDNSGEVRTQSTMIAAAYYPDWAEDTFPPESLDYTRWSILFFAFATPNSSSTLTWDAGSQSMLTRTVAAAKASGAGTRIVLSVGGWSGSVYFSQCVSTAANRTTFVNTLANAVTTYGLDGIDIDWEYPNEVGAGNINSPSDSANLLLFLTQLRTALGSSKIISAAVPDEPWLGANGSPLTNVSAYAAQMTYLNIMNYDVFQSSSTPGPNAPLGNLCGNSTLPNYSAEAAFTQWTAAGFPASKLLLGLPLYGYVSNSTKTALTGSFVDPAAALTAEEGQGGANPKGKHARPRRSPTPIKPVKKTTPTTGGTTEGTGKTKTGTGTKEPHSKPKAPNGSSPTPKTPNGSTPSGTNGSGSTPSGTNGSTNAPSTDVPTTNAPSTTTPSTDATANLKSWYGQEIPFSSIVASGALVQLPGGTFGGGGGFTEGWDNCSDTPFLFNTSQSTVVTYDDTYSLGDKATFAKTSGMAGCFTWSLDQDDGVTLQNVIRASLGLS